MLLVSRVFAERGASHEPWARQTLEPRFRLEAMAMSNHLLLSRIRAEYLEMPGLRLTLDQAQRLCGVERALCKAVFDALVAEKFLHMTSNGTFARLTEGAMPRPRPAKADLVTERQVATAS